MTQKIMNNNVLNLLMDQHLDPDTVKTSIQTLIDCSRDMIDDVESEEEKVILLYSIKVLCLTYGLKRPNWWYTSRNKVSWLDTELGAPYYDYDLGGY